MRDGGGRREPVDVETLRTWEADIWSTSFPLLPPFGLERQVLDEWGITFNRTRDEDRDELQRSAWPWSTACVWVAWQTFDGAANGMAAFRHWRGRIWREGGEGDPHVRPGRLMSLPAAERELRNALEVGRIKATAIRGDVEVPIPAGEWPRLAWEKAEHGEVIEFDHLTMLEAQRYSGVVIPRAALLQAWPALDGWTPAGSDVVDVDPADVREVRPEVPAIAPITGSALRESRQRTLADFPRIRSAAVEPPMPVGLDRDEYHRELNRRCGCKVNRSIAYQLHREVYPDRPGMGPRRAKSLGKKSRHK